MARPLFSRALCLVLVSLVLTSPALLAEGSHQGPRQQASKTEASALLSRAWQGLVSFMRELGLPVAPASDNGSTMDPNGGK
jgi:hypothetical protein